MTLEGVKQRGVVDTCAPLPPNEGARRPDAGQMAVAPRRRRQAYTSSSHRHTRSLSFHFHGAASLERECARLPCNWLTNMLLEETARARSRRSIGNNKRRRGAGKRRRPMKNCDGRGSMIASVAEWLAAQATRRFDRWRDRWTEG